MEAASAGQNPTQAVEDGLNGGLIGDRAGHIEQCSIVSICRGFLTCSFAWHCETSSAAQASFGRCALHMNLHRLRGLCQFCLLQVPPELPAFRHCGLPAFRHARFLGGAARRRTFTTSFVFIGSSPFGRLAVWLQYVRLAIPGERLNALGSPGKPGLIQ
jgi:hypothetical protein